MNTEHSSDSHDAPDRLNRGWLGLAILAVLLALGLRGYMAIGSLANVPVTTDESITVLQAKRITEGEWPLLVWAQPYQFTFEAYLSAPLVNVVPRNTLGARYVSFLEGLAALLIMALLARRLGPWARFWPAYALILFPSAYLLMIQFGYSLPHNSPVFLMAGSAMLLTLGSGPLTWPGRIVRFFLAGLFCGLAFTTNMLALSLVAPVLIAAMFQGPWRRWPVNLVLLALGLLAGLIPYLAAVLTMPGAHSMVAGTRTIEEALRYLWTPAITMTLTRAMGLLVTLYPDTRYHLDFPAQLYPLFPFFFAAILVAATFICAVAVVRTLAREKTLRLGIAEVFVGITWLNLAVFVMSARGYSGEFRYLAPAALSFPFLLGAVYARGNRWIRGLLGALCLLLVAVNVIATVKLVRAWRAPDFAEKVMDTPDLAPTLAFLRERNIKHCVAAHWQAYRINFLTDEQILCSQPINERFTDWPLPYKAEVDAATNVAYVMLYRSNPCFTPATFESDLKTMRINFSRETFGAFSVYYDFQLDPALASERPVDDAAIGVSVSHNGAQAALLHDGACTALWDSHAMQETNMWIQMDLSAPMPINRLTLYYGNYCADRAPALDISIRTAEGWRAPVRVPGELDPFAFENGHPVYGRLLQTIRGAPLTGDAVRIEIAEPNPRRYWSLAEITLHVLPPAGK